MSGWPAGSGSHGWRAPDKKVADLADPSLREALASELHYKLFQSLPLLRNAPVSELLTSALNFRRHHLPPHGGARAERRGRQIADPGLFDPASFSGPMFIRDIHDTFGGLFGELELIHRLCGVQFVLLHEGLLGHYRSGRLLPWTTSVTVGLSDSDFQASAENLGCFARVHAERRVNGLVLNSTKGWHCFKGASCA